MPNKKQSNNIDTVLQIWIAYLLLFVKIVLLLPFNGPLRRNIRRHVVVFLLTLCSHLLRYTSWGIRASLELFGIQSCFIGIFGIIRGLKICAIGPLLRMSKGMPQRL